MTSFPGEGDNYRALHLTPLEAREVTLLAYRHAIKGALDRGDKAKAEELQAAHDEIKRRTTQ